MFARKLAIVFCTVLLATPALADSVKSLGKFGEWESFAYVERGGKVCYTASLPKRSLNSAKGRGEVYVSVTHRTTDKSIGVVSVAGGYPFKKDAPAEVDVGGAKFDLYTSGETAWTRDDKAVVQAMLKNKGMVVHGTPAKGETTVDTYSLDGFVRAYAEIGAACGVK
jgi:hypothetical protein